jgi:prepilin-type N-terminal cleavage/methylation domain-containing protein
MRQNKHNTGFTLIELVIVLMIIALLIAAIFKGNQLIDGAREKQLEKDFSNIPLMIYAYQDKYKAIPGDDKNAASRFSGITASVQNGDGDGLITGNWFDFNPETDNTIIWQHLRLANLMSGEINLSAPDYLPVNALGKLIDIQSVSNIANTSPINDAQGHALHGTYIICSRGIPGALALTLDIRLDDGNPGTGAMLITLEVGTFLAGAMPATVGTNTTTDISSDKPYIVCMGV